MKKRLRHHDTQTMNYLASFQNPSFHDFPDRSPAIPYDHTLFSRSSFDPSSRPFDHLVCFSHICSSLCFDFRALPTPVPYMSGFTPLCILDHRHLLLHLPLPRYLLDSAYQAPDCTSGIRSCLITPMLRCSFMLLPKRSAGDAIHSASIVQL